MGNATKTRAADPAPWFRTWPGVEQLLTEGMTSRQRALWHTLRLKFWAGGCRPMSMALIERTAATQNLLDAFTDGTGWVSAILGADHGLEERPGEGWAFTDLLDYHAETIRAKEKSAEAGRKGGLVKRTSAPTGEARPGNGDPDDF